MMFYLISRSAENAEEPGTEAMGEFEGFFPPRLAAWGHRYS